MRFCHDASFVFVNDLVEIEMTIDASHEPLTLDRPELHAELHAPSSDPEDAISETLAVDLSVARAEGGSL